MEIDNAKSVNAIYLKKKKRKKKQKKKKEEEEEIKNKMITLKENINR